MGLEDTTNRVCWYEFPPTRSFPFSLFLCWWMTGCFIAFGSCNVIWPPEFWWNLQRISHQTSGFEKCGSFRLWTSRHVLGNMFAVVIIEWLSFSVLTYSMNGASCNNSTLTLLYYSNGGISAVTADWDQLYLPPRNFLVNRRYRAIFNKIGVT